jgi:hypothetical protein
VKKRAAALALLCLVMVSLFFAMLLPARPGHWHAPCGLGGGCAQCARLQAIGQQRKETVGAAAGLLLLPLQCFTILALLGVLHLTLSKTPIQLKIRFND